LPGAATLPSRPSVSCKKEKRRGKVPQIVRKQNREEARGGGQFRLVPRGEEEHRQMPKKRRWEAGGMEGELKHPNL